MIFAGVALGAALLWYFWERSHRKTHAMSGGLHDDILLPHETEFELYHNSLSLCSKKVRVCLAELGIDYTSHPIDLIETGSYENISRHFLVVNPSGIVPVLVHNGHPIYESHEQIRYAAEHSPNVGSDGNVLIPASPELATKMDSWIERTSLIGDDPISESEKSAGNAVPGLTVPLFAAMIVDIPYSKILEGLLFHRLKVRPLLFLVMKLRGIQGLAGGLPAKIISRSARDMAMHLDSLEEELELGGGPWLLGSAFSLADVGWVPIFERLAEADSLHCFVGGELRPRCTAYWGSLKSRPSYKIGVLDSVHETVVRGTERLRAAKQSDAKLRAALEPIC
jgi:glutathione S-transferase